MNKITLVRFCPFAAIKPPELFSLHTRIKAVFLWTRRRKYAVLDHFRNVFHASNV